MCGIFFYVLGYCMWINKKFDLSSRYLIYIYLPTYGSCNEVVAKTHTDSKTLALTFNLTSDVITIISPSQGAQLQNILARLQLKHSSAKFHRVGNFEIPPLG